MLSEALLLAIKKRNGQLHLSIITGKELKILSTSGILIPIRQLLHSPQSREPENKTHDVTPGCCPYLQSAQAFVGAASPRSSSLVTERNVPERSEGNDRGKARDEALPKFRSAEVLRRCGCRDSAGGLPWFVE
jgi:hypothetical protein